MLRERFDLHDISIDAEADDPGFLESLGVRFRPFRRDTGRRADLSLIFRRIDTVPHAGCEALDAGRLVYESPLAAVRYIDVGDRLTVSAGRLAVHVDLGVGAATFWYAAPTDEQIALATQPLLSVVLMEVFKRRRLFPLHAAAVARSDRVVLLVGDSGVGKSTLSVALGLAGFDFMSDDLVLIDPAHDPFEVRPFPDAIDLADAAAIRFAATAHLAGATTWGGRPKHRVTPGELGLHLATNGHPVALLFPELTHGSEHGLDELTGQQALMSLVPNVLLTDATASRAHLDVLGALLSRTPCHRLRVGTDLEPTVELIGRLL